MAIRIECNEEGWEKIWIDFRSKNWPFKDRRKMVAVLSDIVALPIILGYVEEWYMLDEKGKEVPLDKDKGIEIFDELNDPVIIPWIISAFYQARSKVGEVSKNSS